MMFVAALLPVACVVLAVFEPARTAAESVLIVAAFAVPAAAIIWVRGRLS